MNPLKHMRRPMQLLYSLGVEARLLLPRQACHVFGDDRRTGSIERVYVINLDRQPARWLQMQRELSRLLDAEGRALTERTIRVPAYDAASFAASPTTILAADPLSDVHPFYTLREQLCVEPQPKVLPGRFELDRPIPMSWPEIAVAQSHIAVWRLIANGHAEYALVLEDDAYVHRGFGQYLESAWAEMTPFATKQARFDLLYVSYKEVSGGAQKTLCSRRVFRPVRGLWYLSGYVLSRDGAQKLLSRLPCRGPVDLWINLQFDVLDVRGTRRSLISQRSDGVSNNSYSILPVLSRIGVADWSADALFPIRPQHRPIFAFGDAGSDISSLAMALLMLGYRCISDLDRLPRSEHEKLLTGSPDRLFDAYANIGSLGDHAQTLKKRYPDARFIVAVAAADFASSRSSPLLSGFTDDELAILRTDENDKWKVLCEHLRCPPPACAFPAVAELGQRHLEEIDRSQSIPCTNGKRRHDLSPWVLGARGDWRGVAAGPVLVNALPPSQLRMHDTLESLNPEMWEARDDTFPGNMGLFRTSNVECQVGVGAILTVRSEPLGVRDYSAAAISSRARFLFGRFEAMLRVAKVSGLVTGFFLHRDSPRQEIDVEIVGRRTDRLLVNVFYNPGGDGANFDYGYRGTPTVIDLGFDASKSSHRFCIEWSPDAIRWLVDGKLVHERVEWDPTPIPRLPMTLHVNAWPSRSRELAGRLAKRHLPGTSVVESITVDAYRAIDRQSEVVAGFGAAVPRDVAT